MKKRIKNITSIFILISVLISFNMLGFAAEYEDVGNHWANSEIEKWSELEIIQGSNSLFRPNDLITRGEMAVILDRIMKYEIKSENSFSDLKDTWYTDSVLKLNAAGIMQGSGKNLRPTDSITREEASVMIGRALGLDEIELESKFVDSSDISKWALGYVNSMAESEYIQGVGENTFKPKSDITRAAGVKIFDNIIKDLYGKSGEYGEDVSGLAILNTSGVKLKDLTIDGDLILTQGAEDIELENVNVNGRVIVHGGNSISISGTSDIKEIVVDKKLDGKLSIEVEEGSKISLIVGNNGALDISGEGQVIRVQANTDNIFVNTKNTEVIREKEELVQAEIKAQKSFNTLPVFVNRQGDEINSGDLHIPETGEDDFPYLSQKATRTKNQEGLDKYGYIEREYFLKGNANVYGLAENGWDIEVLTEEVPYINRVLVYMPENPEDFKGVVYTDIFNASSGVDLPDLWRRGYEHYMKHGYAYVGITSKDVNVNSLKRFNPERYDVIDWTLPETDKLENGLAWDIFGQVGGLLKENDGASRLLYGENSNAKVERSYLIGQSQSGFYLNTFNNGFGKANYKLGTDEPLYDGMINVVGTFRNTELSTDRPSIEELKDSAVPYVIINAENDYVGMFEEPKKFKPDSNTDTNKFRHYVVTGAAHSSKIFPPDTIDELQIEAGRDAGFLLGFKPEEETGLKHTNADLDMDVYFNGILKIVDDWVAKGIEPAPGMEPDTKNRDKYGNMVGGIRSPQISVPIATYTGGANGKFSVDGGSMVYLTDEQISERYPNGKSQYLEEYRLAVEKSIADGWMTEKDRDRLIDISKKQSRVVFDGETYDKEDIEQVMTSDLDIKKDGEDLIISGPANVYGVLKDDLIYIKKGNLPKGQLKHNTRVNITVPEDYDGNVVINLMDGDMDSDNIPEGAAEIRIDLDQIWELPHLKDKYRGTNGFIWDIISQISNSVEKSPEKWGLDSKAKNIKLIGDKDKVKTYEGVFSKFKEAYNLTPTDMDLKDASVEVLAEIYTKEDGKIIIDEKITDTTVADI